MPSPEQEALFERLKAKFGTSPQWERLTRPYDFCTMSRHKAFHYLQLLLWQLARKAVPSRCSCVTSARSRPDRDEHPPGADVRNRAVV